MRNPRPTEAFVENTAIVLGLALLALLVAAGEELVPRRLAVNLALGVFPLLLVAAAVLALRSARRIRGSWKEQDDQAAKLRKRFLDHIKREN